MQPYSLTRRALTVGGTLLALANCAGDPEDPRSATQMTASVERLRVATTSWPVDWLVARIAGDAVDRHCVLPAGADPPFWRPDEKLIASMQDADLIVTNGAGYEAWIATTALPLSRLLSSSDGSDLLEIQGVTHSHGRSGAHSHAGTDPHTWFDPLLFLEQAQRIRNALVELDPDRRQLYDRQLTQLAGDLHELDRSYRTVFAGLGGRVFATSHPAYGYLARRYGLQLAVFELDPQSPPVAAQLAALDLWQSGRSHPTLFWETQPDTEIRALLSERITQIVIDPLEQPGTGNTYDYLAQAGANLELLRKIVMARAELRSPSATRPGSRP